jgi:hypothetical protein
MDDLLELPKLCQAHRLSDPRQQADPRGHLRNLNVRLRAYPDTISSYDRVRAGINTPAECSGDQNANEAFLEGSMVIHML